LDVRLGISGVNQEVAIEITSAGGKRRIRLGDTEIVCDWVKLAEGHYSLILDGSVFDLMVSLDTDLCTVASRAGVYSFRIMDPRRARLRPRAEEGSPGLQRMCAEMPGKIVRVLVREGESVAYDQGLLVLEAMKMQNEIRAPKSGVVKEMAVAGGATVNTGDFLLSIES
jgi:acetyl/propionyl-CoA carboxylase alpha subunit